MKRYPYAQIDLPLLLAILMLCASQILAQTPSRVPTALAPILVGPYDGKDVSDNQIVWSWFMQPRASDGSEVICDLHVVEVLDGQTPEEALRVNPLVILKEDLHTSVWQANFAARNFLPSRRYAWRVIAKVVNGGLEQIVSQSEIWTYTYNEPRAEDDSSNEENRTVINSTVTPESSTEHPDSKIFEFTGNSRTTFAASDHPGLLTEQPANLARWQIDPTLKINGVPFGISLLISTEENPRKADINRGAFGSQDTKKGLNLVLQQRLDEAITETERQRDSAQLDSLRTFSSADSATFAERIAGLYTMKGKDLSENLETLKSLGLATEGQERIAQFPSFGFGKVAPQFSRQLFSNVTINGAMAEYNPGLFYAAGAVGKVQRPVNVNGIPGEIISRDSAILSSLEFYRNVYSARIGFGKRSGNNLIVSGLYAGDDEQSRFLQHVLNKPIAFSSDTTILRIEGSDTVSIDTVVTQLRHNTIVSEQINKATGISGHLELESLNLILDGEMNFSYLKDFEGKLWEKDRDTVGVRSASLMEAIFHPSEHELYDFNAAARARYSFPENTGGITGGYRYVGGGFTSVGVAGLRTDVLRYDAQYDHLLLDRQMRLSGSYTFEEAGYKQDKFNLSTIHAVVAGVEFRFNGLPVLQIDFSNHNQHLIQNKNQDSLRSFETNSIRLLNAVASYAFSGLGLQMETFATVTIQDGTTLKNDEIDTASPGTFRSRVAMLTQRIGFGRMFSIGFTGSYTSTVASNNDSAETTVLDLSLLYNPITQLQCTGGVTLITDRVNGATIRGAYFMSRIAVTESADIDIRLDYRNLNQAEDAEVTSKQFNGLNARLITTVRW